MTIARIQVRRGSTAQWDAADPVLAAGEWGAAIDAGAVTSVRLGDGVSTWSDPASSSPVHFLSYDPKET